MSKWLHLHLSRHGELQYPDGKFDIFPANRVDLEWLFNNFPKAKRGKATKDNFIVIETKSHLNADIEEAIWTYLEEQGWECFSSDRSSYDASMTFKRLEDNE